MRNTRRTLFACITAALVGPCPAGAVDVASDGTGGALIIPYYTVDNGNTTIVTISNDSSQPKGVKLTVRESVNGRDVLGFNLYLGAYDQWSAAIFSLSPSSGAFLTTSDSSCTVPAIRGNNALPTLPSDGARYVPFRNFFYSGDRADGGPAALTRTRQGYIEVIETATLTGPSAASATPRDCARLVAAWATNGYWINNRTVDVTAPTGSISATAEIIDVAKGAAVSVPVVALENFRAATAPAPHEPPGGDTPTLADATGGIDAVSAALVRGAIANEVSTDAAIDAQTEWVVTFPTKRYHTDTAIVGTTPRAPFTATTGGTAGLAGTCAGARIVSFSADGLRCDEPTGVGPSCEIEPLCDAVSLVRFARSGDTRRIFGGVAQTLDLPSGKSTLRLQRLDNDEPYAWQLGEQTLTGLPVVGFSTSTFTNANAQPGLLATYARTTPHRRGE